LINPASAMIFDTLIRPARRSDNEAIGRIYVKSWRAAYRGILPQRYLDEDLHAERVARSVSYALMDPDSFYLIAEIGRKPVGYIAAGPQRERDSIYAAELYELYLLPENQRHGLGKQLLAHMARRLYHARVYTMMVWVLARNPNRRFYEKCGGLFIGSKSIVFAGRNLRVDAFGWVDITLAMEG
jgi:GNAT superfamily N-acetyltransferase